MQRFPDHISFIHPWRNYQRRVLEHLDRHLENRHLHLVSPPGSGKTVLGLEVMLRVNKPTIILTPTLTIKQQWLQRFLELFLKTNKKPEWISTHIKQPAFVTITTYQALHSLFKAFIREKMESIGFGTIIFDQ
ncbi:MAG: DEAD/DEAH box helicase family protein, partial [Planifilum fimeticola]